MEWVSKPDKSHPDILSANQLDIQPASNQSDSQIMSQTIN